MRTWVWCRTVFLLILMVAVNESVHGQQIHELGIDHLPIAISADGSVVTGQTTGYQAFRWTREGGIQILKDAATVYGISGDGSVVVGLDLTDNYGWYWTEAGGITTLPEPDPPSSEDELKSYSAHDATIVDGTTYIVGIASFQIANPPAGSSNSATHVVRWINGSNAELLFEGLVSAISDDGSVIVGTRDSGDGGQETVKWVNGTIEVLEGGYHAAAVSGDGSFVAGHSRDGALLRWGPGGKEVLSSLTGMVGAMSSDGTVVSGTILQPGVREAFIWTGEDSLRLLRDVLEEDYDLQTAPSYLADVTDISADGRVVAGIGYINNLSTVVGWRLELCGASVWGDGPSGLFGQVDNWKSGVIPGPLSNARFETKGSYSVTIDSDVENNALDVTDNAELMLDTGSYTYSLSAECRAPSAIIENAYLEVEKGRVEAADTIRLSGLDPILKIGNGAHLVVDSDEDGTGCLIAEGTSGSEALIAVADGGKVESHACTLLGDEPDTAGHLFVDGGGRFMTDTLIVGGEGTGIAEVPQGHVTAGHLFIADGAEASATVTVENVGTLHFKEAADVGVRGQAELRLTNAAIAIGGDPDASAVSLLVLGRESGAKGRLFVEDHSIFQNSDAVIGQDGDGTLAIKSGGGVDIRRIWIGGHLEGTSGTGAVSVEGVGSILEARRIWVGRGKLGILGALDGGLIRADQITVYGDGLTVAETGGTISAPILQVGGAPPAAPKWVVMAVAEQSVADEQGIVTDTLLIMGDGAVLEVDTFLFNPGGVLGGTGTFPSSLTNTGVISPGDSAVAVGTFSFAAGYTQAATGILEMELAGTAEGEYDVLSVTGEANLGGTLRLRLTGEYVPKEGDAFEIVRAGSITGAFETVELPEGIAAGVDYGEKTLTLTVSGVTPTPIEEPLEELPETFTLEQNYPNPFRGETQIRFALPEAADVRLVVYDLLGREVARLVEERLSAGYHEVNWDGSDLPSGVYLYRLEAGTFSQTRRMVLAR